MKKVLLVVAHEGFRALEFTGPKEELEQAGVVVEVASDKIGTVVSAEKGLQVEVAIEIKDVKVEDYNGIFLIGGPGAMEHLDTPATYALMKKAAETCPLWGAICISPRILANAILLKGKKVTGWNGDRELGKILLEAGAEYVPDGVVVDRNLITADGPKSAHEFGKKIVELL